MTITKKTKNIFLISLFVFSIFFIFNVINTTKTNAQGWVGPTGCDPATNPGDCNVSAPLNTSDDSQTKSGGLIIENTLDLSQGSGALISPLAAPASPQSGNIYWDGIDLKVYSESIDGFSFPGWVKFIDENGRDTITAPNRIGPAVPALTITNNDLDSRGLVITSGSSAAALDITQTGTGKGIAITSAASEAALNIYNSGDGDGIFIDSEINNATGILMDNVHGTGMEINTFGKGIVINGVGSGVGLKVNSSSYGGGENSIETSGHGNGVYAHSLSNYGLVGISDNTHGIYGYTTNSNSAGVYGCYDQTENCASLGTEEYAGDFEGDVYSEGSIYSEKDVSATGFYTTNNKNSYYSPFAISEIRRPLAVRLDSSTSTGTGAVDSTDYKNFEIGEMAWDGKNMWAIGSDGTNTNIFAMEGSGNATYYFDFGFAVDNDEMVDIEILRNYVVGMGGRSGYCEVYTLDKETFEADLFTLSAASTCYSLTTDGNFIFMPDTDSDYIYIFDEELRQGSIDAGAEGCHDPKYGVYDGNNLWFTCSGTNDLLKVSYDTSTCGSSGSYVNCTFSYSLYNDNSNPALITFDGTYLWVTYDGSSPYVRKLDPNSGDTSSGLDEVGSNTSLSGGFTDMQFDGNHIWLANDTVGDMYVLSAVDPSSEDTISSYEYRMGFDGSNVWIAEGSLLEIWSVANNSFGNGGSKPIIRGILITDTYNDELLCAYIHYTPSGGPYDYYDWAYVTSDEPEFRSYCGEASSLATYPSD